MTTMSRPRRVIAAVLAILFALGACSDGGNGKADDGGLDAGDGGYVDALADRLGGRELVRLDDEDATCLAQGIVVAVGGAEALSDAGVTPGALRERGFEGAGLEDDADIGDKVADAFVACDIDVAGLLLAGSAGPVSPEVETCVRARLGPKALSGLANLYVRSSLGGAEEEAAVSALNDCFDA